MKKSLSSIAIISVLVAASSTAYGQVIAFDNFDYADGSLVPNGGWANHSGNAGDLLVSGGQVVVQHGTPSEDAHMGFSGVSGNVFYGIDFSVNASGNITGTDHEYFAHFRQSGTNNFSARLDVVAGTSGGNYTVGIASDESTADAIWATDLRFGVTYRAVVRYDQDANIAELWIDASLSSDSSILGEDRPDPGDPVDQFSLRQSDSDLNETVTVDGLVIGNSFDDVANPVPEPATMIALGIGAAALLRRRRKA